MMTMGVTAAKKSHNLFLPPYSWMWKLGMMGLESEYKKAKIIDDAPQLLNKITGYFVGAPDALQQAEAEERMTRADTTQMLPQLPFLGAI
jgi:hypothetical protein